jgi:hypothetical protein
MTVKTKKRTPRTRRVVPMPGSIRPAAWKIREGKSKACTGFSEEMGLAEMHVDTRADSDVAAFTRIHELLHVRHSEDFGGKLEGKEAEDFRQALEDARIHHLGERQGVDIAKHDRGEVTSRTKEIAAGFMDNDEEGRLGVPPQLAASAFLCSSGMGKSHEILHGAMVRRLVEYYGEDKGLDMAELVRNAEQAVLADPTQEKVTEVAELLAELFEQADEDKEDGDEEGEASDTGEPKEEGGDISSLIKRYIATMPHKDLDGVPWGEMEVIHHPMSKPHRGSVKTVQHKERPSEMGVVPKHMHRWTTDKAVFSERRPVRTARSTILIDVSGSMHLTHGQIETMMHSNPGCTIALYSGDGERGQLHIVAQRGKRIKALPPTGSGNIVDGPALDWLIKEGRRGRMVWVCDGGVTGTHDRPSRKLTKECMEKVRKNNIILKRSVEEMTKHEGT